MSLALKAAKRRNQQGDFLGIGGALSKLGGFIPGIGGTVSKIGGIIQGIGGAKTVPTASALPGGASIARMFPNLPSPDSVKVTGKSIGLLQGYNTVGVTSYFGGKKKKKYRRINPLNPKALRRSIKRLAGFGEFAKAMGYSRPPRAIHGFKAPAKKRRAYYGRRTHRHKIVNV
jgi:hypothetical protein